VDRRSGCGSQSDECQPQQGGQGGVSRFVHGCEGASLTWAPVLHL
jgi:hypothetical protein